MTSDPKRPREAAFDLESLKELLALMEEHDLSELSIQEQERKVHLKRGPAQAMMPVPQQHAFPAAAVAAAPAAEGNREDSSSKAGFQEITSPMVGTFYRAPSPESPSYVEIGAVVDADTVVCIVEAMKVMNEIKAGVSGTISEVLVENGHVVEFGEPLFRVAEPGA
jgi:acetyl-CoA carboxylase biotin carboxyl carrier protein